MFEQAVIESILQRIEEGRQRLIDNDDILSARYTNNINVLKEHFADIYEVMNGYQPTNKNIFLEADGALNLFDATTGSTVFSATPFKDIEQRYQEFCKRPGRTMVNIDAGQDANSRHEFYLQKLNKLRNDFKATADPIVEAPEQMGAIVLFGFDFGYQLTRILDNHFIKHIYIYEEQLDFFYYSLFAIDWQWVVEEMIARNASLHFFLGVEQTDFIVKYTSTVRNNGLYLAPHTYLYMGYSPENIKQVLHEFQNQYGKQVLGWGFFDDGVIGIGQYLARKNTTYLAVKPEKDVKPGFNPKLDMPVMILGNGPSLDDNIDFVRAHQGDAIIISCGTTINTLAKYGIKPDFHADVERMRQTVEKLQPLSREFLSGITALTVNVMHPDFYEFFDKSLIGLKPSEPISSIMRSKSLVSEAHRSRLMDMHYSAPIVANLGLSYATQFGFSEVFLIGVDCGFKAPDQHHSKLSGYYNKEGEDSGLMTSTQSLLEREANFGGKAFTTYMMDSSRLQLEYLIRYTQRSNKLFQCYNVSDGIKISGAQPIKSEDILIMPKDQAKKRETIDYVLENFSVKEPDSFAERELGEIEQEFEAFIEKAIELLDCDFDDLETLLLCLSKINNHATFQYSLGRAYCCELFYGSFIYFANEVLDYACSRKNFDVDNVKQMFAVFTSFAQEMPAMLSKTKDFVDKRENIISDRYHG